MGHYSYAEKDGRLFLKMCGNLKYTLSSGFDSFLEKILATNPQNVLIDLSEAEYIDSTNLGLIARIAEHVRTSRNRRVTLISDNEDINELLRSVGFDSIFVIVPSAELPEGALEEIADVDTDDRERARMMLRAHKSLMSVDDRNKKVFQDVISLLEQELDN